MPALTTLIAVAGLGLAAGGAVMTYTGQKAASAAQQEAIQGQQAADAERQKYMELDSLRRRRELVRQSVSAQATSQTVASNQGAAGGSGLPGAYSGISGRTGVNAEGISMNEQFGSNLFGIQSQITGAYGRMASANSSAYMGQGLSSLGGALVKNEGAIDRVGTYLGSWWSANTTSSAPTASPYGSEVFNNSGAS